MAAADSALAVRTVMGLIGAMHTGMAATSAHESCGEPVGYTTAGCGQTQILKLLATAAGVQFPSPAEVLGAVVVQASGHAPRCLPGPCSEEGSRWEAVVTQGQRGACSAGTSAEKAVGRGKHSRVGRVLEGVSAPESSIVSRTPHGSVMQRCCEPGLAPKKGCWGGPQSWMECGARLVSPLLWTPYEPEFGSDCLTKPGAAVWWGCWEPGVGRHEGLTATLHLHTRCHIQVIGVSFYDTGSRCLHLSCHSICTRWSNTECQLLTCQVRKVNHQFGDETNLGQNVRNQDAKLV